MIERHVLVIDDDVKSLEVLAEMLGALDVSATVVADVSKLDAILQTIGHIDLALVDLEMPLMNGYEVLKYLRDDLGMSMPIVACTVYANEIANAKSSGFDGFIGKPLKFRHFPTQFERILNGEGVWEAH
jgi:two-component system chemotaxis sensor kinase CheA